MVNRTSMIAGCALALAVGQAAGWSYVPESNAGPVIFTIDNSGDFGIFAGCRPDDRFFVAFGRYPPTEDSNIKIDQTKGSLIESWRSRIFYGPFTLYHTNDALFSAAREMDGIGVMSVMFHIDGRQEMTTFDMRGSEAAALRLVETCKTTAPASTRASSNRFGDTPLHTAARNNDIAAARRIITTAPQSVLCARNDQGRVAAQLADALEHNEIWMMLSEFDATKYKCGR